ncbi:hypothetical protein HDU98_007556 [Podochytrium sp. JEL0797]|nr:hypothetical protein HDU98_007556 [Podochytrium sp. JEL0797]
MLPTEIDFLTQLFELSHERIASILGLEADELVAADLSTAVEIVLGTLFDDDSYSDDGTLVASEDGTLSTLCAVFPCVSAPVIDKVLLHCKGNLEEAAELLALHGNEAVNVVGGDTLVVATKGNLIGRDHDIDTLISMFPTFSVDSAKQLLKSNGGLHNTIDLLMGHSAPSKQLFSHKNKPKRESTKYTSPTASYSKILTTDEQDFLAAASNQTLRFSTTTNINPHIPSSDHTTNIRVKRPPEYIHSSSDPTADDLSLLDPETCRAHAHSHALQRAEAFQQASREFKRGSLTGRGSAQYYSDIGHAHSKQILLWNSRARACVMRDNDRKQGSSLCVIDLHGLTRAEAVDVLTDKLEAYFPSSSRVYKAPLQVRLSG